MALLFADSFDLYSMLAQKYDVVNGAATISSSNPRTGAQSMKTTTSNQWVQKNIALNQTVIAGIGFDLVAGAVGNTSIISFMDGNIDQVSVGTDGSGHLIAYRGGVATGVLLGTSVAAMSFGTYHYIEAKVKANTVSGTVDVHVDGISFLSLAGINTSFSGMPQIGSVISGTLNGGTGNTIYWDDFYICDSNGSFNNTFLGPTSILALLPTGNGSTDQWTIGGSAPAGTNWQSVNENPPNDGVTFVDDGTVGHIDRYTFPSIASAYPTLTIGSISGVVVNLRAEIDIPGARAIRAAVKSSATLGTSPSDLSLTTSWADYQGILETDPNTSAAWAQAAVDAAEFGQKVTV